MIVGLPADLRTFLIGTAAPLRFSLPLAAHLLQIPAIKAARLLAEVRRRALFVHETESEGWFAYHDLVREFLAAQGSASLLRCAADWFEAQGDLPMAVEHALAAAEWTAAARRLEALAGDFAAATGRYRTFRRWVLALPPAVRAAHPLLLTRLANALHEIGQRAEAWRLLDEAAQAVVAPEIEPEARTRVQIARAGAFIREGNPLAALPITQALLADPSLPAALRRTVDKLQRDTAYYLSRLETARRAYSRALSGPPLDPADAQAAMLDHQIRQNLINVALVPLGRFDEAQAQLAATEATARGQLVLWIWHLLTQGWLHEATGSWDALAATLAELHESQQRTEAADEDDAGEVMQRAFLAIGCGDFEQAQAFVDRLAALASENPDIALYTALAQTWLVRRTGRPAVALACAAAALAQPWDVPLTRSMLALELDLARLEPANSSTLVPFRLNTNVPSVPFPLDMLLLSPALPNDEQPGSAAEVDFTVQSMTPQSNGFDMVWNQTSPGGTAQVPFSFHFEEVDAPVEPTLTLVEENGVYQIRMVGTAPIVSEVAAAGAYEKFMWFNTRVGWAKAELDKVAWNTGYTLDKGYRNIRDYAKGQRQVDYQGRYRRELVECMARNGLINQADIQRYMNLNDAQNAAGVMRILMKGGESSGKLQLPPLVSEQMDAFFALSEQMFYRNICETLAVRRRFDQYPTWQERVEQVMKLCQRSCEQSAYPRAAQAGDQLSADGAAQAASSGGPMCPMRTFYDEATGSAVSAIDPNDKAGPPGMGPQHYIPSDLVIPYVIRFENVMTATAPAQVVVIFTDTLDLGKLDAATLQIKALHFGNTFYAIPPTALPWQTTLDLRPAKNLLVAVTVTFNPATGRLVWRFESLDPGTLAPPADPLAGFLPPNNSTGRGQGSVVFTIRPKAGQAPGTQILNGAVIRFDEEAVINTNSWLNTLDNSRPTSAVSALASVQMTTTFAVSWTGSDTGAGIKDYIVWVSENGGAWTSWLADTAQTSALFTGADGHQYRFYAEARDGAGNQEAAVVAAEATTSIDLSAAPPDETKVYLPIMQK